MANTLTPLIDKLIARGLSVLRENAIMPRLVNSTYSNVARDKGDTITVPIAADITAASVSPSNTLAAAGDTALTSKTISLNQWKHAGFYLTDQQITQIDVDNFQTLQATKRCARSRIMSTSISSGCIRAFIPRPVPPRPRPSAPI